MPPLTEPIHIIYIDPFHRIIIQYPLTPISLSPILQSPRTIKSRHNCQQTHQKPSEGPHSSRTIKQRPPIQQPQHLLALLRVLLLLHAHLGLLHQGIIRALHSQNSPRHNGNRQYSSNRIRSGCSPWGDRCQCALCSRLPGQIQECCGGEKSDRGSAVFARFIDEGPLFGDCW